MQKCVNRANNILRIEMKITSLMQTCFACPSQWEGKTEKGQYLYIRYRWGYLRMTLDGLEIYGEQLGGNMAGVISENRIWDILTTLGYEKEEK